MMNSLAGVAAGIMALFGASISADHRQPERGDLLRGHASSTVSASANISCVAAAVAAREQALSTGMTTFTGSVNSAYSTRATALASAYAQSDTASIRSGVKLAWSTFGAAERLARKAWTTAQHGALSQFRTALKACGGSASSVSDVNNASGDERFGQQ